MRSPLAALTPIALALAVGVAGGTWQSGCGGNCGACPVTSVLVTASANVNLDIRGLAWAGPACPNYPPTCRGDDVTTSCTHVYINSNAVGECDLEIAFGSGLTQVVRAEFGPSPKACCPGFPAVGETTFVIPVDRDAGVVGSDGATDAVTTIDLDASTADSSDGGIDAPAADDGATDAAGDSD
jgi:hypothetical protein